MVLKGLYASEDNKLLIGDFDRSAQNQVNVIRSSDLGKLLAQFTDLSHPVTAQNREYDIDNNGTLNSTDISLLLGNLTDISVKGDEL